VFVDGRWWLDGVGHTRECVHSPTEFGCEVFAYRASRCRSSSLGPKMVFDGFAAAAAEYVAAELFGPEPPLPSYWIGFCGVSAREPRFDDRNLVLEPGEMPDKEGLFECTVVFAYIDGKAGLGCAVVPPWTVSRWLLELTGPLLELLTTPNPDSP
jgi:hypothetical protein